jgi:hypothetical protein
LSGPDSGAAGVWRKPSRCQGGECVEVLPLDEVVMLRDSAHPDAVVRVGAESWRMFTDAIRAGEFDLG